MKLYYRGASYEYDPSTVGSRQTRQPFKQVRGSGAAYTLIYRGVTYRVDPNAEQSKVPVSPATYQLIYRGITYFVNRTAKGEVTAVTQSANTSIHLPHLKVSYPYLSKLKQVLGKIS
ncbi:MAG TPA: DUF4278 domain-containing protein [Coleofasciculaceae cyanobacterium]|jgi:hypothetical protein